MTGGLSTQITTKSRQKRFQFLSVRSSISSQTILPPMPDSTKPPFSGNTLINYPISLNAICGLFLALSISMRHWDRMHSLKRFSIFRPCFRKESRSDNILPTRFRRDSYRQTRSATFTDKILRDGNSYLLTAMSFWFIVYCITVS